MNKRWWNWRFIKTNQKYDRRRSALKFQMLMKLLVISFLFLFVLNLVDSGYFSRSFPKFNSITNNHLYYSQHPITLEFSCCSCTSPIYINYFIFSYVNFINSICHGLEIIWSGLLWNIRYEGKNCCKHNEHHLIRCLLQASLQIMLEEKSEIVKKKLETM